MRVGLGVLSLLAAAGLGWLLEGDRMSPLALTVVEWQTRLGPPVPLYVPFLVVGIVVLLSGLPRRRLRRTSPAAPPTVVAQGAAGITTAPAGEGHWVVDLIERGRGLPLEGGATLCFDMAAGVPVGLRLSRLTPEVERRSVETFATYLASIPTPPRVRVEVEGAVEGGAAQRVRHLLHRALRQLFPPEALQVLLHSGQIDVIFSAPDPRWGARKVVFMEPAPPPPRGRGGDQRT